MKPNYSKVGAGIAIGIGVGVALAIVFSTDFIQTSKKI